jgi:murein L,D-transpeptidase YcbB/YkuD
MERAIEFAHFLVASRKGKQSELVEKLVSDKQRNTVNLDKSIPIYIRYFTAEVVNGEFRQYDDVYGLDSVFEEKLVRAGFGSQN